MLTPSSARRFGRPRELDACKGAPEPHGLAVRETARSSVAPFASTASRLTFVTIAKRPSCRSGTEGGKHILLKNGSKIFLLKGLDGASILKGLQKFRQKNHSGCAGLAACAWVRHRAALDCLGVRASTSPRGYRKRDVEGRDGPGHDGACVNSSGQQDGGLRLLPRPALRSLSGLSVKSSTAPIQRTPHCSIRSTAPVASLI